MDIVFLISHLPDPRYKKRFDTLSEQYKIAVIYWKKRVDNVKFSDIFIDNYEIAIKANQYSPFKRIPQWLEYGKKAISKMKQLHPKCIYVGNFDMLAIAEVYQKIVDPKVQIIYEIADLHRYLVNDSKKINNLILKRTLVAIEKCLLKKIDLLVLTSMKFYEVYYSKWVDSDIVVLLPNMPNKDDFKDYKKVPHDNFTVGYVGTIRYKEQLKMLISAAKKADVNVYFAGASNEDDNEIEELCKKNSDYCSFRGPYNYSKDIVDIYEKCNVIYSVYDASIPNVRVALPNKLYEALICELPIIVAKETYLSELVEEWGSGVSVTYNNIKELADILLKLKKDKIYYSEIVKNCRKSKSQANLSMYTEKFRARIDEIIRN